MAVSMPARSGSAPGSGRFFSRFIFGCSGNISLMKRILGITMLLALSVCLAGCAARKHYDYQAVKDEFRPEGKTLAGTAEPQAKPGAPKAPAGPLSLKLAIKTALRNNPDRAMALDRIGQSEALLAKAMAPFYPMLRLSAGYSRGDAPSAYLFSTIDQRNLAPDTNFNAPGTFQNWDLGLGLEWNLFRGGGDYLRMRMAETGVDMSRLDTASVINGLVASVTKGFYNCLAAREFAAVAEKSRETVSSELNVMRLRFREGGALKSDVLSLEVRLAQARENVVIASNNHKLALAALANLLGLDVDAKLDPEENGEAVLGIPPHYQRGLAVAFSQRPELLKARRMVVRARMGVDAAKSGYWPSLNLRGRYWLASENLEFETENGNWTAGIAADWDVFSGFSTRAEEQRARAFLREMLGADRKAGRDIQLDVKRAYLNLAAAKARLDVTKASAAQAEESLDLVRKQFEGGAAGITRYLDAELALTRTRMRCIAARYDQIKARADVARALGRWADAEKEKPGS